MVRRHLGFGVDEWCSLPWWQAELYKRGLIEEHQPTDSQYRPLTDPELEEEEAEASLEDFENMGMTVRRV